MNDPKVMLGQKEQNRRFLVTSITALSRFNAAKKVEREMHEKR